MSDKRPEDTIRDGALKSTIWKNQGEKGDFYSAQITKTYRDERGDYRDATHFASNDLLRVSELARRSHNRINELRREQARESAPERFKDAVRERER